MFGLIVWACIDYLCAVSVRSGKARPINKGLAQRIDRPKQYASSAEVWICALEISCPENARNGISSRS